MAICECNIVAEFPGVGGLGIISASLRASTVINVTEGGLVLEGPTTGDLSISAYAPLFGESLSCQGRAGCSFQWEQRIDCDSVSEAFVVHFIPRGRSKAYSEGDVTNKISFTTAGIEYETFNASASSGPHTPYLKLTHTDGYDFRYTGGPIAITADTGKDSTSVSFFNSILPAGSSLYLTSFNWEYNPPNVPTVNYSFLFAWGRD
jgi:hypothetical protein